MKTHIMLDIETLATTTLAQADTLINIYQYLKRGDTAC